MKYIANILVPQMVDFDNFYNVITSKEEIISEIPTLVIGWEFTKSLYKDVNILDWKISDNIYWTFGNREKRNKHDNDIKRFKELAVEFFLQTIKYKFINILNINEDEKIIIKKLFNKEFKFSSYIFNNMVYIYDNFTNIVYGISLLDVKYANKNIKKFLSNIYECTNNISNKELILDAKSIVRQYNYLIPCLK